MAIIDNILVNIESEVLNSNTIKDIVLDRLLQDKLISEQQFDDYSNNWQIIIVKKSWFKKWKDNLLENDKNDYMYQFVKFNN